MGAFTENADQTERLRRLLIAGLLILFSFLLYLVIAPFLAALAWSVVIALSLWPLYRRLAVRLPRPDGLAAFTMSAGVTLVILIPLTLAGLLLAGEAQRLGEETRALLLGERGDLLAVVERVPIAGERLREGLLRFREDPGSINRLLESNKDGLFSLITKTLGNAARNAFKIMVCIFATYFLFRYGEGLGTQISEAFRRLGGARAYDLLVRIRLTVRATVYGLVLTAIVQGILAALGFWVAGVEFPLILGAAVFVLSFIPFGPPVVWLPAGISVLSDGRIGAGVFLLIWGAGVVSTMDNILRPIFIGKATSMSVLLVFIGVIGGVMAFGMVGLFIGPVVVAVALALWQDWIRHRGEIAGALGAPLLSPPAGLAGEDGDPPAAGC